MSASSFLDGRHRPPRPVPRGHRRQAPGGARRRGRSRTTRLRRPGAAQPRWHHRLRRVARPRHIDDPLLDVDPTDLPGHRHRDGGQRRPPAGADRRPLPARSRREPRTRHPHARRGDRASRSPTCAPTSRRFAPGERASGPLPPIYLATLRDKMLALAAEVADGAIWANASRSQMAAQLARVPDGEAGGLLPGQHDPDRDRRRPRRGRRHQPAHPQPVTCRSPTTATTGSRPATWRRWRRSRQALDAGDRDALPSLMSDAWLHDCTLVGLSRRGTRRHRRLAGRWGAPDRGDVVDEWRPAQGRPRAVRRLLVGRRRPRRRNSNLSGITTHRSGPTSSRPVGMARLPWRSCRRRWRTPTTGGRASRGSTCRARSSETST